MISRRNLLGGASAALLAPFPALGARVDAPFRIALVGDCLFTGGLDRGDTALKPLLPLLRGADLTIGNFEGTLADPDAWAIAIAPEGVPICGGMNIRGGPDVADDLAWLGIDMMGTANNHAMDWGPDGILATLRKLTAAGLHPAGTGIDLAAARRASFDECRGRRVALIACASTFWPGTNASRANPSVPGRPGVNPVRFRPSTDGDAGTEVHPLDLKEIVEAVETARAKADIVIVSCHTHESAGSDRLQPPGFLIQLAHACGDVGASAFFSHGPHVLRGLEIYKGMPVFYSLGAFIFRARESRALPEEAYEVCDLVERTPEAYFRKISTGWDSDKQFWESAIAELEFQNGQVAAITLSPTVIEHRNEVDWGMPALAARSRADDILARLQDMSGPYGTVIANRNGQGIIRP